MPATIDQVRTILTGLLGPCPEADGLARELASISEPRTYAKGDAFVRAGDASDRFAIVASGLYRAYYLTHDGKRYIRKFYRSPDLMGAFATALVGAPAHVTIEALADGGTVEFRYADFAALRARLPQWEKISRVLLEKNYVQREARAYQLLAFDAAERYRLFQTEYRDVADRISKGDIASYLGISPVSLSRIIHRRT